LALGAGEGGAGLRAVLDHARAELSALPWFSSVGQPPAQAESAEAKAYLRALDADASGGIRWVSDWAEAERIVRDPAGAGWWAAEAGLHRASLAAIGPVAESPAFIGALNEAVHAVSDVVMGAAARAAARDAVAGEAVIRVAAGAAGEAPDHPFEIKLRLYAGGRWPLGLAGEALAIF
jgi:hypothetical protein